MSKRVRGAARPHRRPGTRPPSERTAARRRPTTTAATSELEVAEILAEEAIEERPAARTSEVSKPTPTVHPRHKIKAGSLLAARAATEYVYVAQDIRRIVLVAGGLTGLMIVLWLLVVVFRVIPLPFY